MARRMKVFISHSSSDRYIAQTIAARLESINVEPYLAEINLKTGLNLSDEIKKALEVSDEILILLTPEALESHWVMIEVGAAWALGKPLIPILYRVNPNELPQPISIPLSRDLNEIDKYFAERQASRPRPRVAEAVITTPRPQKPTKAPEPEIQVADQVKILEPSSDQDRREQPGWSDGMDPFIGLLARVDAVEGDYVQLNIDGGRFRWALRWLERIEHAGG